METLPNELVSKILSFLDCGDDFTLDAAASVKPSWRSLVAKIHWQSNLKKWAKNDTTLGARLRRDGWSEKESNAELIERLHKKVKTRWARAWREGRPARVSCELYEPPPARLLNERVDQLMCHGERLVLGLQVRYVFEGCDLTSSI